jgi:hypothetical protein
LKTPTTDRITQALSDLVNEKDFMGLFGDTEAASTARAAEMQRLRWVVPNEFG